MFNPGEVEGTVVAGPGVSPSQVQVSADGRWVMGRFGGGCGEPNGPGIVKIDLRTGSATVVAPFSSSEDKPVASPFTRRRARFLRAEDRYGSGRS